jgi:hypothetical protein
MCRPVKTPIKECKHSRSRTVLRAMGSRSMKSKPEDEPVAKTQLVDFETVRVITGRLPGAVEGISYGTPAFRVGGKLFVRQHQDGEALVVKIEIDQRAMRMRADPWTFFITDHYLNYPWILVRLASVDRDDLADLLYEAWLLTAPKRLLAQHDADAGLGPSKD